MKTLEGTITSKGQLVIPAKLRRDLKIGAGTRVRFERIKGGIAVYPRQIDDIRFFRGIFSDLGLAHNLEKEPDRELE